MAKEQFTDRNRNIKFRDSKIFDVTNDIKLLDKDPYIVSDYHLLDDYIKNGDEHKTKTKAVMRWHNKTITDEDDIIYLGDLSGDEIYQTKDEAVMLAILKVLINQLHFFKAYFIIGNNDRIEYKDYYIKCGFNKVYAKPILYRMEDRIIVFSHEPVDLDKEFGSKHDNILNIHGHIHGSKEYWGMKYEGHIDVYRSLYNKPMRLSELIKFYDSGKYNHLVSLNKTEN